MKNRQSPLAHLVLLLTFAGYVVASGCSEQPSQNPDPEVPTAGNAVTPGSDASGSETPPSDQSDEAEVEAETTDAGEESVPVSLETLTWDATQELIASKRGTVVVVDLWQTFCPPCVRELPHLFELAKSHPDDVACISVALDYAGFEDEPVESHRELVFGLLQKMGGQATNILCATAFDTILGSESVPHASLPVVLVYDADGKLAGQFPPDPKNPEEFTYQADVLPLVQKLLENPGI